MDRLVIMAFEQLEVETAVEFGPSDIIPYYQIMKRLPEFDPENRLCSEWAKNDALESAKIVIGENFEGFLKSEYYQNLVKTDAISVEFLTELVNIHMWYAKNMHSIIAHMNTADSAHEIKNKNCNKKVFVRVIFCQSSNK